MPPSSETGAIVPVDITLFEAFLTDQSGCGWTVRATIPVRSERIVVILALDPHPTSGRLDTLVLDTVFTIAINRELGRLGYHGPALTFDRHAGTGQLTARVWDPKGKGLSREFEEFAHERFGWQPADMDEWRLAKTRLEFHRHYETWPMLVLKPEDGSQWEVPMPVVLDAYEKLIRHTYPMYPASLVAAFLSGEFLGNPQKIAAIVASEPDFTAPLILPHARQVRKADRNALADALAKERFVIPFTCSTTAHAA